MSFYHTSTSSLMAPIITSSKNKQKTITHSNNEHYGTAELVRDIKLKSYDFLIHTIKFY